MLLVAYTVKEVDGHYVLQTVTNGRRRERDSAMAMENNKLIIKYMELKKNTRSRSSTNSVL